MMYAELIDQYLRFVLGHDTRDGLALFDVFYLSVHVTAVCLTKSLILWYTFN